VPTSHLSEDVLTAVAEQLGSRILAHLEPRLAQLRERLPEPHYTIADRLESLGWHSATRSQRDKIRNLALAMIRQAGFARPVRESESPSAELLFPVGQISYVDDAILRIWREAERAVPAAPTLPFPAPSQN